RPMHRLRHLREALRPRPCRHSRAAARPWPWRAGTQPRGSCGMIGPLIGEHRRLSMEAHGWLGAHKWLLLRRTSQIAVMALFMLGPIAGIWLARGNFASSEILGALRLTDPYIL